MRNRIVHVQKIESVKLRHFRHARGQRQIVRRIVEQRITGDVHFVIVNVGMQFGQPDGLGVGNEMDFVPALRQFQTQFGGHHAAAAVGGIAGDPDLHAGPFARQPAWLSDSMATGRVGFRFCRVAREKES